MSIQFESMDILDKEYEMAIDTENERRIDVLTMETYLNVEHFNEILKFMKEYRGMKLLLISSTNNWIILRFTR